MTRIRYASIAEVIDREIVPALGDFGNQFDIDSLARAAFRWAVDVDAAGNQLMTSAGFEAAYEDEAGFWEIASRHEIPTTTVPTASGAAE